MKQPIHIFGIESEKPNSSTSIQNKWRQIRKKLFHSGVRGITAFHEASNNADLCKKAAEFGEWTKQLHPNDPVVLWISIHGFDPERGVADKKRKYVATAGETANEEKMEWEPFFSLIKTANVPGRIIVLMDVCWGSSPTVPSRLTTPAEKRPAFLFGPTRAAKRSELNAATERLFRLLAKDGIPLLQSATDLVYGLNSQFAPAPAPASGTPFYRMWWWDASGLNRYPNPP